MEKMEKDIMEGALEMFRKFGIRSVTMDDVAGELGISKKTIYKYFENKEDLVCRSVRTRFEAIQNILTKIHQRSTNAIDELIEIDEVVGRIMKGHNPGMRFQMQKYYPQTFNELFDGQHRLLNRVVSENIESGKRDGWYRKNADTEIISFLYCAKMDSLPKEERELIEKHSMPYLMHQALEYHIRGLASEKGLKYLEEKLKLKNKA